MRPILILSCLVSIRAIAITGDETYGHSIWAHDEQGKHLVITGKPAAELFLDATSIAMNDGSRKNGDIVCHKYSLEVGVFKRFIYALNGWNNTDFSYLCEIPVGGKIDPIN